MTKYTKIELFGRAKKNGDNYANRTDFARAKRADSCVHCVQTSDNSCKIITVYLAVYLFSMGISYRQQMRILKLVLI